MNKKNIKYIGFYSIENSNSKRVSTLAAINKMNYVISTLNEIGYNVEVLSPSWLDFNSKTSIELRRKHKITDELSVSFPTSWKARNKIALFFKILFSMSWLFFKLFFRVKKDEKVIVYHVPWVSLPIRIAKFFKRFKIILEVEEVYQDVMTYKKHFIKWENKLLESADYYIFSTDLLKEKLKTNKESIVLYGEYKTYDKINTPIDDGKIHLLYAGIIDNVKKGAFNAIEAAKYLNDNYVLHMIGFGDVDTVKKQIKDHNEKHDCKIIFDGSKHGNEYIEYCQKCHIGLSTQSNEGKYLESSFPSKILSYLSMGLSIVSADIECVKKSKISNVIQYYSENNGESIAKAIMDIKYLDSKSLNITEKLHKDFLKDLNSLINN